MATKASRIALAGSNISSTGEVDADLLDNIDSAAFLSLDGNGRLGIGTSSPSALLHLKSTNASTGPSLIFENTNNAQNMNIDFWNNAGALQSRIQYSEGPASFNFIPNTSNADSALYIKYGGNIGINNSNPSQRLTVNSPGGSGANAAGKYSEVMAQIHETGGQTEAGRRSIMFFNDVNNWYNGTEKTVFGMAFNNNGAIRGGIQYDHKNTERMTIWSGYGPIEFKVPSVTNQGDYRADQVDLTPLTIENLTGNVGINNNNPSQRLDVNGDIRIADARSLFFQRNGDAYAWRMRNESAQNNSTYGFSSTNKLIFEVVSNSNVSAVPSDTSHNIYPSSANTLVLTEHGRVGIGIDNPAFKLDVSGTGAMKMPVGTTAQRPTGAAGALRFNTSYSAPEVYTGTAWVNLFSSPGLSSSSPAISAKWMYDNGVVTSGKDLYWITTPNGGTKQVFCDFDTQDENGNSGWMLVASFATAQNWTYGTFNPNTAGTTSGTIGTSYSGNQISSNFGDYNCEMFRVCCNSSINTTHGSSAHGDWYYYKSGGTSWKEWWAPASGFSYYNGFGSIINDGGTNHGRQMLVPFTHAHNIRFNYTSTNHVYQSLSDASVNTSGYYAGGNTTQYWQALTTSGSSWSVFYQAINNTNAACSDGTLGILPQGYTGNANATGQDINACHSKIGYDDTTGNSSFGSSATSNFNTQGTGINTTTGAMFWIK